MLQSTRLRLVAASVAFAVLAACGGDGTAPVVPASIVIVSGNVQTGVVGQAPGAPPMFVVKDEAGKALGGVSLSISVTSGGGTIGGAPRKTSAGPTSVGIWTLGQKAGLNQLTVTVSGLPPIVFEATAKAGATARMLPLSATAFSGRVAEKVSPAPMAQVVDAFGNPVRASTVLVSLTGGGTASPQLESDDNGIVAITDWTLGTKVGQDIATLSVGAASVSFVATKIASDPVGIVVVSGDEQPGVAGAPLPLPIVLNVVDRFGNPVTGQTALFTVTSGGGVLSGATATADANGAITVPSWTLGRTAVPQTVHVAVAGGMEANVSAFIQTDYHIEIRFFGPELTEAQKALFTNAAARLSAIVTGDVPDVTVTNFDAAALCGLPGLPMLNETIDDLVIYASIQSIDGPGKILAEAGPCGFRTGDAGFLTSVGVMEFDAADIDRLAVNGTLQDVITHEMLHVLGIGTLWTEHGLLDAPGTPSVTYNGAAGLRGCLDSGGAAVCAGGVPVENNGVVGTADAHWRETTFRSELMTGFVNSGGMPLSAITIGSLQDLGYTVNLFAADPFSVSGASASTSVVPSDGGWERPLRRGPPLIPPASSMTPVKRR